MKHNQLLCMQVSKKEQVYSLNKNIHFFKCSSACQEHRTAKQLHHNTTEIATAKSTPVGSQEFLNVLLLTGSKLKEKKQKRRKVHINKYLSFNCHHCFLKPMQPSTQNKRFPPPATGSSLKSVTTRYIAQQTWLDTSLKQFNTSLILQKILSEMEIHFTVQVLLNSSETVVTEDKHLGIYQSTGKPRHM